MSGQVGYKRLSKDKLMKVCQARQIETHSRPDCDLYVANIQIQQMLEEPAGERTLSFPGASGSGTVRLVSSTIYRIYWDNEKLYKEVLSTKSNEVEIVKRQLIVLN